MLLYVNVKFSLKLVQYNLVSTVDTDGLVL